MSARLEAMCLALAGHITDLVAAQSRLEATVEGLRGDILALTGVSAGLRSAVNSAKPVCNYDAEPITDRCPVLPPTSISTDMLDCVKGPQSSTPLGWSSEAQMEDSAAFDLKRRK